MSPTASPGAAPVVTRDFDITGFDLHDPAFLADPYPRYAAWRTSAPLARVVWPGEGGQRSRWVFRHADVKAALDDQHTFVKALTTGPSGAPADTTMAEFMDRLPRGVFSSDPPRHTGLRSAVEGPFRVALAAAPAIATALAHEILDGVRATHAHRMELMSEYAIKLPSGTLFALLGIPRKHWPALIGMVVAIVRGHDTMQSADAQTTAGATAMALGNYLQVLIRELDADTLVGRLRAGVHEAGMTDLDLQSTLRDFIVAGFLSTTFLIGTGVLNLLQHPAQLALLRDGEVTLQQAVNEMLRHDAPAQIVDRVVAAPTTLGGVALERGETLRLVIGSANRDERVFADADAFDMARTDGQASIPFGAGIHHCIGAPLVALVAPVAIGALVERFPDMALAGLVQWQTDPYLRSPVNVPLAM